MAQFFGKCALLDYPEHQNIGDHLLWIASILYLEKTRSVQIGYVSSLHNFSSARLKKEIDRGQIVFAGGGSFGDLWPAHQQFREDVIASHHDNSIIILPQSIYFQNEQNLQRAAAIFNAHPDLTMFVRDQQSYDLATKTFTSCKVFKAPDMVFALCDLELPKYATKISQKLLYLHRNDAELNSNLNVPLADLPPTKHENWFAFEEKYSEKHKFFQGTPSVWKIPGTARLYREYWQRRLRDPALWKSRRLWKRKHAMSELIGAKDTQTQNSWLLVHDAICQLKRFPLVLTDRLHGHILSVVLGIPNVFLPNSYGKNERFYDEWTHAIPSCKYVDNAAAIAGTVEHLISQQRQPLHL
ncbi:polysaccharide pyruvyl transferase family protein [soil metagenome]